MPPLLIIGAGTRAAAQCAAAGGFHVSAVDHFGDRDLRLIARVESYVNYPTDILAAADRLSNSPWMYVGGLENEPDLIDRLAAQRMLLGNGGDVLRQVREPLLVAEVCVEAGLPMPAMKPRLDVNDDPAVWLWKSPRSSGGLGVRPATAARPDEHGYFQARSDGEPAAAAYVSAGGECRLLGVTGQLSGAKYHAPRPFQYVGSFAPFPLLPWQPGELQDLGRRLTQRFGLVGVWGLDFLWSGTRPLLPLEVNPRYCASFEILEGRQRPRRPTSIELHVAACTDGTLPSESSAGRQQAAAEISDCRGKGIVYAERDCRAGELFETWLRDQERFNSELLADIPLPGTAFRRGDPVLTIFSAGSSRQEMLALWETVRRRVLEVLSD